MTTTQRYSGDAFREWIDRSGVEVTELAELLAVEYQSIWRVMNSRSRPGWKLLLKIIRITSNEVTANDFTHPLVTDAPDYDPVCREELAKRLERPRRVQAA